MEGQNRSQEIWGKVLETAQIIWKKSIENFDKLENKEKTEQFKNYLDSFKDEFEENKFSRRIKKTRNSLAEEQKLKIYKRHSISIWTWVRYSNLPLFWLPEKIYTTTKNAITKWNNHTWEYAALEEIPCRFLVQLGILDKPKWLTDDKLKEDIKKDAKNGNLWLSLYKRIAGIGWWVATATGQPEITAVLESLSGLIVMIQHYTKWYEKEWTKVIIEWLNKKKKLTIKQETNQNLAEAMNSDKRPTKKVA